MNRIFSPHFRLAHAPDHLPAHIARGLRPAQRPGRDGRRQRRLQVATRILPGERHQHPAARLVDRDDGTIFVQNRDDFAGRERDVFWPGHAETLTAFGSARN